MRLTIGMVFVGEGGRRVGTPGIKSPGSVFVATIRDMRLSLRFGHHICGYTIRTTCLWLDLASQEHVGSNLKVFFNFEHVFCYYTSTQNCVQIFLHDMP